MLFQMWDKLLHWFHNLKIPRGNVILYWQLLYTCKETVSELVFFVYLIDEIVTRKNLWIGLNSKSDIYSRCLFWSMLY